MDGPWGHFGEPTHALWLIRLAEYVLLSILAVLAVWRWFVLDIIPFSFSRMVQENINLPYAAK